MYCPNCGKQNADKNHFCRFCGASLCDSEPSQTGPAKEKVSQVSMVNEEQTEVLKKRSGVVTKIIIIAMVVGMIICAAIVGLEIYKSNANTLENAVKAYIEDTYEVTDYEIQDYREADTEEIEMIEGMTGETIEDAVIDVEVIYRPLPIVDYESTVIDIIYKDDSGWHVYE